MTQSSAFPAHRFSVAPMLDVTDRHARYFYRALSKHSLLYTEMITTGAILNGNDPERFLAFNDTEHPVALQLGGSDPNDLSQCTRIANNYGYDEVNLNIGCPSPRVQSGSFGACLMAEPELVRDCIQAMRDNSDVPVTVKCRLGIDDQEDFESLLNFIDTVALSGCTHFIIHARNAWLQGLSPKENRDIPPLRYEWVYRAKALRPELTIVINGGINTIDMCLEHLEHVDGVMLGRAIQRNPMLLTQVDHRLFGTPQSATTPHEHIMSMIPYIDQELSRGTRLQHISRHLVTAFQGVPGAKQFRRHISEHAHLESAGSQVVLDALDQLTPAACR
ncbi:MAG: tRNA dihydrouridine(20/20a) synthase DusA [Pseudomonadota bacterium]